jgi:hypothetical protein
VCSSDLTPTAPPPPNRAEIAHDIARRVEQRLAAELPRLVAAAVADYLAGQDNRH